MELSLYKGANPTLLWNFPCIKGHSKENSIFSASLPTPSLRECSSSVRGAVAPSCSIISAPSLSAASSHSTPAATRWMFSMGEYSSCKNTPISQHLLPQNTGITPPAARWLFSMGKISCCKTYHPIATQLLQDWYHTYSVGQNSCCKIDTTPTATHCMFSMSKTSGCNKTLTSHPLPHNTNPTPAATVVLKLLPHNALTLSMGRYTCYISVCQFHRTSSQMT